MSEIETIETVDGRRYVDRRVSYEIVFTLPRPEAPWGEYWFRQPDGTWRDIASNDRRVRAALDDEQPDGNDYGCP